MVKIKIPSPLRKLTDGKETITISANTVKGAIESMSDEFPGIKERFYDNEGNLRKFMNIYLNNEDVRFLQNLDTVLKDGDEITIIPAIAGGSDMEKKIYLTFTKELIKEPIIYKIGHKFKIVTNIRQASVTDEVGIVALEITGEADEIEKTMQYLREIGVKVDPIELNVVE